MIRRPPRSTRTDTLCPYTTLFRSEHTIRAVGLLAQIEKGGFNDDHPLSSGIMRKVLSRRALYVAVLLHDIAKGRGGDHRSEEHTSELQSLMRISYAVFCLKKNTQHTKP